MKKVKIYHYNAETREFSSETDARVNPKEPGEYLVPSNATIVKPLKAKEGKAVVFDGVEWQYVPDYRGKTIYNVESGASVVMRKLGPLPEGYAESPKPNAWSDYVDGVWVENADKKTEALKNKARKLMQDAEWYRDQYRDERELGIDTTLQDMQYMELLTYINELRNAHITGVFPSKPSFV